MFLSIPAWKEVGIKSKMFNDYNQKEACEK